MQVTKTTFETDGTIRAYGLHFANGLVIRNTKDLAWVGKDNRQLVAAQIEELADNLQKTGYIVEGKWR